MALESTFERKVVVPYLKGKGCHVFKLAGAGVPTGTPDRLFLKEGFWGMLEVKASKNADYQPLQKPKIAFYHDWSYCRAVYPENWDEVRAELDAIL